MDNFEFDLKKALMDFVPYDESEKDSLNKIKKFLNKEGEIFSRSHLEGHIPAGALVVDGKGNVLLNHHKALNKWLHFGGHSDGEANSLNVAKREVLEEAGIQDAYNFNGRIFDVDVHSIPENTKKCEPQHFHYDIRFLFLVRDKHFVISDESDNIEWKTISEAKALISSHATLRMLNKYEEWLHKNKCNLN